MEVGAGEVAGDDEAEDDDDESKDEMDKGGEGGAGKA